MVEIHDKLKTKKRLNLDLWFTQWRVLEGWSMRMIAVIERMKPFNDDLL